MNRPALGPMPSDRRVRTVDERVVRSSLADIFALAADVERWPAHLSHYRHVRFLNDAPDGCRVVEMSANRPFGALDWPTWWTSRMSVAAPGSGSPPAIRFTHIAGVTKGMDVEWTFEPAGDGTLVRIVHVWNGPSWPLIGEVTARHFIAPVFVHGIASRTLAGLAGVAERSATSPPQQTIHREVSSG